MSQLKIFKIVILINIASWVLIVVYPESFGFIYGTYDNESSHLIAGQFAKFQLSMPLFWLYAVAWVIVPWLLLSFKKEAKYLFIGLLGFDMILVLFTGLQTGLGEYAVLTYISTMSLGAILIMLHNSFLGREFN